jgi:hypothetical protein
MGFVEKTGGATGMAGTRTSLIYLKQQGVPVAVQTNVNEFLNTA